MLAGLPPAPPPREDAPTPGAGVGFALAANTIWGLVPAYWKTLADVPAHELTAWRALWAAGVGLLLLIATRRTRELGAAFRERRLALPIVLSGALIAVNWLVFIHAVGTDRVSHTSLGYYVNPLVSVALGFLVLRERLRPAQWAAVAVAATGVVWWTLRLGGLPWIAAALAASFALYGLVRKLVPVAPLVGFALEMLYLAPLAAAWLATRPSLVLADADLARHAWVAVSGVVTAAPLVCFAAAARRLPLAVLGIFQYIAPSLALLLAVAAYGEAFTRHHAISFGCVAAALTIFTTDSLHASRRAARIPA
jgi:chloramphenicol-sensitive protein RarD